MRNVMKTLLTGTALASFLIPSSEAMIFPDRESLDAARTTSVEARYSLIFSTQEEVTRGIESRNPRGKGLNSLIFQDQNTGKRVGMSCAHFKKTLDEDNDVIPIPIFNLGND